MPAASTICRASVAFDPDASSNWNSEGKRPGTRVHVYILDDQTRYYCLPG